MNVLLNWIDQRLRWKSWAWIFAVLASTLSALTMYFNFQFLETIDRKAQDYVVKSRATVAPSNAVAVVSIDEKSIKQYGRWPWKRTLQADLILALKKYQVGVIGLDIIYLRPEDDVNDLALTKALQAPGAPVIGGYFFREQQTFAGDEKAFEILRYNQLSAHAPADKPAAVLNFPYVETNQNEFSALMAGLGFFNIRHDIDGLIRRTPLMMYYDEGYYPSLALKTLAVYCDLQIETALSDQGVTSVELSNFAKQSRCDDLWQKSLPLKVPINLRGEMWLDFYKDPGIPIYSASDILNDKVDPQLLKDKMVFVGVTEIGIADLRPTPIDDSFPGVAVHATAVSNLLLNHHFEEGSETVALINSLLILCLPIIIIWTMARCQKPFVMFLIFVVIVTMMWMLFQLFINQQLLVSLVYPSISIIIAFLLIQTYFILTTQRHARFLRGAFSSYVSPNLVDILVKRPDKLNLQGESRNISVLFSDIRGFTTLSESLDAEVLVAILNDYLGPMTDIVMDHQGTLDKYIGDAVMAIYNAPIDVENHPIVATKSALMMLTRLDELNQVFQEKYKVALKIGIGIHSGQAIVGNMGSAARFDYTAMGDTVNLASRIEGRTKAYGVELIVTEDTWNALDQTFLCRKLDKIRVKGKMIPVEIFEVLSIDPTPKQKELVKQFEIGLNDYFSGDFERSCAQFQRILQQYPDDGPSKVFLQRCQNFQQTPPEGEWDGVFTATDK